MNVHSLLLQWLTSLHFIVIVLESHLVLTPFLGKTSHTTGMPPLFIILSKTCLNFLNNSLLTLPKPFPLVLRKTMGLVPSSPIHVFILSAILPIHVRGRHTHDMISISGTKYTILVPNQAQTLSLRKGTYVCLLLSLMVLSHCIHLLFRHLFQHSWRVLQLHIVPLKARHLEQIQSPGALPTTDHCTTLTLEAEYSACRYKILSWNWAYISEILWCNSASTFEAFVTKGSRTELTQPDAAAANTAKYTLVSYR